MPSLTIDTGIITLSLSNDTPPAVQHLLDECKEGRADLLVIKPVVVEAFKHICRLKGIDVAREAILSFLKKYPVKVVDLEIEDLLKAGTLKCQNEKILSYNDAMIIAYALNNRISLHSTESFLRKVPNSTIDKLRVVKYKF